MARLRERARERLDALAAMLDVEAAEARARDEALWDDKSAAELEKDGVLARKVVPVDRASAMLGRVRLTFAEDANRKGHLDAFAARPGSVVRVALSGVEEESPLGVVLPSRRRQITVIVDHLPDSVEDAPADLYLAADAVTHARLARGLAEARENDRSRTTRLIEILLGREAPRPTPRGVRVDLLDEDLHETQVRAVEHGVFAEDVALIHGPFGTGKTRVLTEIVRQATARSERVLCAAASNAAVDHLALSLLRADPELRLVRVGHPARAHEELEAHTAAGLAENHEKQKMARRLTDEAFELRRRAFRRSSQGRRRTPEEREMLDQARALFREARELERSASAAVLENAQVVCGTLTGFASELERDYRFELAVIDEASQALTPAIILAALRADRLVLGGDHHQLPPTIVSRKALDDGLGRTVFEELMEAEGAAGYSAMLDIQHRMHERLMRFPSESFYADVLRAQDAVASIDLSELGFENHGLFADEVLEVIDTAGAGVQERSEERTASKSNPEQAALVARMVDGLIEGGLSANQVGVITPYAAQVGELRRLLSSHLEGGLEIDSVDGFQGREKEAIVFDAVRSNDRGEVGFLSDHRRLNVALTRAKRKLIVVGDSATLAYDPVWERFFGRAGELGAYRSCFELP